VRRSSRSRQTSGLHIHAYFGVDLDIIWDVVSNKLPILEVRIREIAQA
jgi:uncharacterized protein with HEPN domain